MAMPGGLVFPTSVKITVSEQGVFPWISICVSHQDLLRLCESSQLFLEEHSPLLGLFSQPQL